MKPFEFLEPVTLEDACVLLSRYGNEAKIIAGGQSLLVLLKASLAAPKYLINLKGLSGLEYVTPVDNGVRIGALTTHRTLELSPWINEHLPMISEMERVLGNVQVRNWGTIGGDLCQADPAGDAGPVFIALGAMVKAVSIRGERTISLEKFFVDYLETVLDGDEVLTEIEIPAHKANAGGAYVKYSTREADFAVASAAVVLTVTNQIVEDIRIVLGAVGSVPFRVEKAEKAVTGMRIGEALEKIGEITSSEVTPVSDIHGSMEYRRDILRVVVRQATAEAATRAQAH